MASEQLVYAAAMAMILKIPPDPMGFSQALALVAQPNNFGYAQAIGLVGRGWKSAQAQADIKTTYRSFAQAQAQIV